MTEILSSAPGELALDPLAPANRRVRFRLLPKQKVSWRETGIAVLFLAPSLAVFITFFYLPFAKVVSWGTYRSVRGGTSYTYVGGQQYRDVLTGHEFRDGLLHSIQFVLLTVPLGLVLGVLLAVAAHRRLKGIKIFQTIFSSTLASSVAVSAVVFSVLLNPKVGVFKVDWENRQSVGHLLSLHPRPGAMVMAALPTIWQNLGLAFVIVLAGLQAVPDEVLEAATLDGYGPVRRLLRVTLPLISPVLLFLFVVLTVQAFQAFAQIEIVTAGGPSGSTETTVFKIFRLTQSNYGAASVMAVGLFGVTLLVTAVQFAVLNRRVHYGN
ncbi:MAG: permease component of ABC-type sugar transporter [Acidimicrobiales bacterium]|nr:permease component of ABC-type sugar transporter [Acidimicrobiales bacterium]